MTDSGTTVLRREVHHRVDLALAQQAADQLAIAGVADHQFAVDDRRAEARDESVEHGYGFVTLAELAYNVAADVPGATGHEDCHDE